MDVSSPMGLSLLVFILTTGNFHDVHGKSFLSEKRSLLRKPAASNFVKFRPNILIPGARPDGIAKMANKGKLPNDDGKPHMVPLSFIGRAPIHAGMFVPEKAGLLLHEYYGEVYRLHPKYSNRQDLEDAVLSKRDPLIEKNDPYRDDNSIDDYIEKVRRGTSKSVVQQENSMDTLQHESEWKRKFRLDKTEESEFTKTTVAPLKFNPFVRKKHTNEEEEEDEMMDI